MFNDEPESPTFDNRYVNMERNAIHGINKMEKINNQQEIWALNELMVNFDVYLSYSKILSIVVIENKNMGVRKKKQT